MGQTMEAGLDLMRQDSAHGLTMRAFERCVKQGRAGTKSIHSDALGTLRDPVSLLDLDRVYPRHFDRRIVVLTLNGGLGTSMGLSGPKGLLRVRGTKTFLDYALRRETSSGVRFARLDSYRTAAKTAAHVCGQDTGDVVMQGRFPRLQPGNWKPASGLSREEQWAPPGHGDLLIAIQTSGVLSRWLAEGRHYLFVRNVDNLGATVDLAIPNWMRRVGAGMAMEVTRRTNVDSKGGHLGIHRGRLLLRESCQVEQDDVAAFQDFQRHRWFNTNNLWFDLRVLEAELQRANGIPDLPVLANPKNVVGRHGGTVPVVQLETALGSAIGWIPRSCAIAVPRTRFMPVKLTSDLLYLRSDAFRADSGGAITSRRSQPTLVDLDRRHYGRVDQLEERFPHGPPSLVQCDQLSIDGGFVFGAGVVCVGDVALKNPSDQDVHVPAGTVLGRLRRMVA